MKQTGWRLRAKRLVDYTVAAGALVATAPLTALTAVAVLMSMGSPVLFRQERPGLHGKPFMFLKFRTMREGTGSDAERLTAVGAFLRKTSLDELPQLWNVLRGDMSIVGPRPLLMEYLDRYTPEERRRHDVLPGITGLTGVSGRNALSWEERFRLDLEYVDRWSLALDAKILLLTAYKVILREGASSVVNTPELRPQPAQTNGASSRTKR